MIVNNRFVGLYHRISLVSFISSFVARYSSVVVCVFCRLAAFLPLRFSHFSSSSSSFLVVLQFSLVLSVTVICMVRSKKDSKETRTKRWPKQAEQPQQQEEEPYQDQSTQRISDSMENNDESLPSLFLLVFRCMLCVVSQLRLGFAPLLSRFSPVAF